MLYQCQHSMAGLGLGLKTCCTEMPSAETHVGIMHGRASCYVKIILDGSISGLSLLWLTNAVGLSLCFFSLT